MFGSLPLVANVAIFAAGAAAVWIAGIKLSDSSDVLSERLGLGQALGGLILLAIATNLPEIAITVSAALAHNLGIAIGNILGGIAIQTVVLAVLDAFGSPAEPLTYRGSSLQLVLEAGLVVALLVVVIMGSRMSADVIWARVTPATALIVVFWVVGLWLVGRARTGLPWHEQGAPPDGQGMPRGASMAMKDEEMRRHAVATTRLGVVFGIAALVTLAAGVVLEEGGSAIADRIGLSGVLFGATVLAAATALPEVSTGLASLRLGDYQLAISDIFGGNAFLPTLFLVATVLSGSAVLPEANSSDIYLTALGILLTVVYMFGLIFRERRQWLRFGPDSLLVVSLYALGVVGLIKVTHG